MELIQMASLRSDYHDLHLKSTIAMKLFVLTLSVNYQPDEPYLKGIWLNHSRPSTIGWSSSFMMRGNSKRDIFTFPSNSVIYRCKHQAFMMETMTGPVEGAW